MEFKEMEAYVVDEAIGQSFDNSENVIFADHIHLS